MATDNSYVNALVGAVVTILLSFTVFSPLLGGTVAGFLERQDGGRIGTISGAFAALPLVVLLVVGGGALFTFMGFGDAFGSVAVLLLGGLFVIVFTVALSAVGGIIGVYLAEEFRG